MDKKELRREIRPKREALTTEYLQQASQEIAARLVTYPYFQQVETIFCYVSTEREPDTRAILETAWSMGKRVTVPRCLPDGRMEAVEIHSYEDLEPARPFPDANAAGRSPDGGTPDTQKSGGDVRRLVIVGESGREYEVTISREEVTVEQDAHEEAADNASETVEKAAGESIHTEVNAAQPDLRGRYGILEPKQGLPVVDGYRIDMAIIPCVTADRFGARLGHGAGYYDRFLKGLGMYKFCLCFEELLSEDGEIPMEESDIRMDRVITEGKIYNPRLQNDFSEIRKDEKVQGLAARIKAFFHR